MLRTLLNLFRRPTIRMGSVDNSRMRTTRIRNAQFVSFFVGQGCAAPRTADMHEVRLRRQKLVKTAGIVSLTAGVAWVAVESAKALSMF